MVMRPDERSYEASKERSENFEKGIKRVGKTAALAAASYGGAALAGAGHLSKVLPFLSEYIPTDLAVKGISKVSPKMGEFLQKGMEQGLNVKEGLDFIKQKISSSQQKAPDQRNIIEQYSPELSQFIQQQIQNGRSALEAGALAQLDKKFLNVIKKMETDHKSPFSSILQSIFGGGQMAEQNPQSQAALQGQQAQGQSQPGQGQQALMAILQKIQQSRGGK